MLACLCLSTLIASCANNPPPDPVIEIRYQFLPDAYLVPCAKPAWSGGDWLAATGLAISRGQAIDDCNRRLLEAREYQNRERERQKNKKFEKKK